MKKRKIHTEDVFMDSGAWAICRLHVLKLGGRAARIGKHGRMLEPPKLRGSQGDFSYYKSKAFRKYCDEYAQWIKEHGRPHVELFANVDAIGSPEQTWENQIYFEEKHGLKLVPVVHCGADVDWVHRYKERGYDIVGLGGYARKISKNEIQQWTDRVFAEICPKENNYLPTMRVHGFALTSLYFMTRWPWWSVDSTSWVKYSAYGWLCLPHWTPRTGFIYDTQPLVINLSSRSPFKNVLSTDGYGFEGDLEAPPTIRGGESGQHFHNANTWERKAVHLWLKHIGLTMEQVENSHEFRSQSNLHYFMELVDRLPAWPWKLDERIAASMRLDRFGVLENINHEQNTTEVRVQNRRQADDGSLRKDRGEGHTRLSNGSKPVLLQGGERDRGELPLHRGGPDRLERLRIYFSGGTGLEAVPESLVPQLKPRIMLTYYDIEKSGTRRRFRAFIKRKEHETKNRKEKNREGRPAKRA